MDIAISEIPTLRSQAAPAQPKDLGDVGATDFMNILLSQLQNQDPFEPMDNQEMLAQISTIRELELTTRLTAQLEQLTDQQRFTSVAALIGKYAQGEVSDDEGNTFPVEGVITGVRFTADGKVLLDLDSNETLPLSDLKAVTLPGEAI